MSKLDLKEINSTKLSHVASGNTQDEQADKMLSAIVDIEDAGFLNEWEEEFIGNMIRWREDKRRLTDRQFNAIEKIYIKHCD